MILGRSLTLWTGAVAAVLNAVVLANIVTLTGDQVAALNGAVFAVLALVAANEGVQVAKGAAAAARLAARKAACDPLPYLSRRPST